MSGPLAGLARLANTRSRRQSSWDRTGGNDDRFHVQSGETLVVAEIDEPGVVRHIWTTLASQEPEYLRKVVIRMFWDGAVSYTHLTLPTICSV